MEQLMQLVQAADAHRVIMLVLAALILVVAMVKDFNGVAKPLAERAILFVEQELQGVAKDKAKLEAAVDFVLDFLPMPYRMLVPRAVIVAFVQSVFNREFAADLDRSKQEALVRDHRVINGVDPVGPNDPQS